MSEQREDRCEHCGALTVIYKHSLSRVLIAGLRKALESADALGRFDIASCGLTNSERQNLSKLKYWGLIKKQGDPTGKGGVWIITVEGLSFAEDALSVQKTVRTYRDEVIEFSGKKVWISDLSGGWRWRQDYARDSRPFLDVPTQGGLFQC